MRQRIITLFIGLAFIGYILFSAYDFFFGGK